MHFHSKITGKGQTTIPVEVRRFLNLKEGDQISYFLTEAGCLIRPKNLTAGDVAGMLGPPPNGVSYKGELLNDAIKSAVSDEVSERNRSVGK